MLNQIFPHQFDNNYRGHKIALWLFALLVLMKLGMSLSAIFDGDNMARSADGIPIDTFTSGGAEAVVSITALLGLSHLLLASLGVLALISYRAMIPLMYVLLWSPNGLTGFDWVWLALALALDIGGIAGSAYGNRDRLAYGA